MAYTQGMLDAIDASIASGASSVSYEGKSTSFRSLDELLRIRNIVAAALGQPVMNRTLLTTFDRGYVGGGYPGPGIGWWGGGVGW